MRRLRSALVLLLAVAGADRLAAQPGSSEGSRPALTRLAWGSVNVLVHADSSSGVVVWAATTSADPAMRAPARQRDFNGRFAPSEVERWSERVATLLQAERFAEGDTASAASAALQSPDSATAGLFRRREGDRLGEDVFLFFAPKLGGEPLLVRIEAQNALAFANAMLHAAALGRMAPDAAGDADADRLFDDEPVVQETTSSPVYPAALRDARVQGEVWMQFVVDGQGRAVPESMEALLSDHDLFTHAVRAALRRARYRPATRDGWPTRQLVRQRFVFSLR